MWPRKPRLSGRQGRRGGRRLDQALTCEDGGHEGREHEEEHGEEEEAGVAQDLLGFSTGFSHPGNPLSHGQLSAHKTKAPLSQEPLNPRKIRKPGDISKTFSHGHFLRKLLAGVLN